MKTLDSASEAAHDLATERYRIRPMSLSDIEAVTIPWMRAAGWNPGVHDAAAFLTADPTGFLVGEHDGKPIACVSAVRYDESFGFFGCYMVAEAWRGRGYGLAIHEAGRRYLEGCVQGGDGVLENVPIYEQIGRVFAWRNARYERVKTADWNAPHASETVDARSVPFEALEQLDRACFPAPRSAFLTAWIYLQDAHARAVVDAQGALAGYGVIRQCYQGWKIGPLFAEDAETADTLFRALVGCIPIGDSFVLDIPEPNVEAVALVRRYAMREVFATARMYTGPQPSIALPKVFGITTFELG